MPMDRPIPAFYCCYLLRSTVRHSGVYVGSTPNPVRRLGQHNGITKGGAVRTSRQSLRPWEMACIVTGFPSHIAALQFEWAWQNPHLTLHIPQDQRLQHATAKKRSGQPKRPKHSVTSLLSNLHLLLRVPSFSRWPLELKFFSEDVYKSWLKWSKVPTQAIRESINVVQDFGSSTRKVPDDEVSSDSTKQKSSHGIQALVVNYTNFKTYVEKAKNITDFEQEGSCAVCKSQLENNEGLYTICPNPVCEAVSHVTCLSNHFLAGDDTSLVPVLGNCPSCQVELKWVDIVKELSLRIRGQNEVEKLLKVKRVRKGQGTTAIQIPTERQVEVEEDEQDEEMISQLDVADSYTDGNDWDKFVSDGSDTESNTTNSSPLSKSRYPFGKSMELSKVVEDSEWDDAEIIE